jgi:hypothetical protein
MLSKNIRQFGTVAQQAGAGSVKAAVSALKNGTKVASEVRYLSCPFDRCVDQCVCCVYL